MEDGGADPSPRQDVLSRGNRRFCAQDDAEAHTGVCVCAPRRSPLLVLYISLARQTLPPLRYCTAADIYILFCHTAPIDAPLPLPYPPPFAKKPGSTSKPRALSHDFFVSGLAGHESGRLRRDLGGHAQASGSIRVPEHPGYRRDVGQDRTVSELSGGRHATALHRRAVSGVFRTSSKEGVWHLRSI